MGTEADSSSCAANARAAMKGPLQMLGLAGGLLHRTTFRRQSWLITRRNLKKFRWLRGE